MATYQAPIYNYVLRLVGGDAALAEDLCQEIFMKVHQGLKGFNMQCRFTTWLFQIAKYRVLDELRARERRVQTPVELDRVPPAAIAAAPEVGFEQMDAVFRAIGELNTDMRAALLLRDVVGLSYNEIAEALEISLATTKWRIFKARELTAARLVAEGVLTPPSTTTSLAS
jgi:RNA polymerase sigma-70 factor (ECF subfamily)